MGDGSLIVPKEVHRNIATPSGVSWVSKDKKLNVEHMYLGFILIPIAVIAKSWKKDIFLVLS